ncbi:hypothetical protein BKA62DRAFT_723714 [Auriculariales sp. MPI-PUGE-AT-0066]|nr:hypothetical protein BKA62DRAFT_723714 [Auriculariales sp. MPI-PUGE-AT-0066]
MDYHHHQVVEYAAMPTSDTDLDLEPATPSPLAGMGLLPELDDPVESALDDMGEDGTQDDDGSQSQSAGNANAAAAVAAAAAAAAAHGMQYMPPYPFMPYYPYPPPGAPGHPGASPYPFLPMPVPGVPGVPFMPPIPYGVPGIPPPVMHHTQTSNAKVRKAMAAAAAAAEAAKNGEELPPAVEGTPSTVPDRPKKSQVIACFSCKEKKLRCDMGRPKCTNCLSRHLDCAFPEAVRRRGPGKKKKEKEAAAAAAAVANGMGHVFDGELILEQGYESPEREEGDEDELPADLQLSSPSPEHSYADASQSPNASPLPPTTFYRHGIPVPHAPMRKRTKGEDEYPQQIVFAPPLMPQGGAPVPLSTPPAKRGRGRPKGSTNKNKPAWTATLAAERDADDFEPPSDKDDGDDVDYGAPAKKKRKSIGGRSHDTAIAVDIANKGRGRRSPKKGSFTMDGGSIALKPAPGSQSQTTDVDDATDLALVDGAEAVA